MVLHSKVCWLIRFLSHDVILVDGWRLGRARIETRGCDCHLIGREGSTWGSSYRTENKRSDKEYV